jgi:hypothetical protein
MTEPDATMTMADIDRLDSEWASLMARARAALARLEESSGSQDDSPPCYLMRPGAAIHEFGDSEIDTPSSLS